MTGSTYSTVQTPLDPGTSPNHYRQADGFGKLCLSIGGFGRPFATNPKLYDHVIVAINNCPRRVSFEICYYQTRNCVNVDMPADQRKEIILGVQPGVKDFRYELPRKDDRLDASTIAG